MQAKEDEDAVNDEGAHTGSEGDLISHRHLAGAGKEPSQGLNAALQTPVEMNACLCNNNHFQ